MRPAKDYGMQDEALPNCILVGAPKCGTAAICAMLEKHPQVFVSERREQNFFSVDLDHLDRPNRSTYVASFANSSENVRIEGTTWYLYSRVAAQKIHEECGEIPIIIILRCPADLAVSLFEYRKYFATHNHKTIREALDVEEAHLIAVKQGHIKPNPLLIYRDVGKYYEGVKRYIDMFGPERVKVIIYEEFRSNQASEINKITGTCLIRSV